MDFPCARRNAVTRAITRADVPETIGENYPILSRDIFHLARNAGAPRQGGVRGRTVEGWQTRGTVLRVPFNGDGGHNAAPSFQTLGPGERAGRRWTPISRGEIRVEIPIRGRDSPATVGERSRFIPRDSPRHLGALTRERGGGRGIREQGNLSKSEERKKGERAGSRQRRSRPFYPVLALSRRSSARVSLRYPASDFTGRSFDRWRPRSRRVAAFKRAAARSLV